MKSVEDYFNEVIQQYRTLEQRTTELANEIASLSPEEILERCTKLQELQKEIAEDDTRLIELMKFIGSDILDMPFLGEYQRALDKAIKASDKVAAKAYAQKSMLSSELEKLTTSRKGLASYKSASTKNSQRLRGVC